MEPVVKLSQLSYMGFVYNKWFRGKKRFGLLQGFKVKFGLYAIKRLHNDINK